MKVTVIAEVVGLGWVGLGWVGLFGFHGISTIVGYIIPNPFLH